MKFLKIAWYLCGTQCLGPGNRFALWVQGCRKHCPECIAEALQNPEGGQLAEIDSLVSVIQNASGIQGITVSGGEPFLQAEALAELLRKVKNVRPELGVILYTGMLYEEWLAEESARLLLQEIDLLIDGAYLKELDDGKPMRGSSNQRLIFLTERYHPSDMPSVRTNEFRFSDGTFRLIGIPSQSAKQAVELFRNPNQTEV